MNEFILLLKRIKTRDALLLFAILSQKVGGVGVIEKTTLEKIAFEANRAGYSTGRGGAFTASVVRKRLEELEASGVIARGDANGAEFDLYVYQPYPTEPTPKPAPEEMSVDPWKGARPLLDYKAEKGRDADPASVGFRFQNENENENENENAANARTRTRARDIKNNILKKKERKNEREEIDDEEPRTRKDVDALDERDDRPTTDDVRARVDFADATIAARRDEIAREIWERDTRPDLIDRIVAAEALGLAERTEIAAIIRDAKDSRRAFEKTGRGAERIWRKITPELWRIYEANGWKWTKTTLATEPKPKPIPTSRGTAARRSERRDERVDPLDAATLAKYEASDAFADFDALQRKIERVEGASPLTAMGLVTMRKQQIRAAFAALV